MGSTPEKWWAVCLHCGRSRQVDSLIEGNQRLLSHAVASHNQSDFNHATGIVVGVTAFGHVVAASTGAVVSQRTSDVA
ncbi:MAG TPA: hypothetical protein VHT30_01535 [Acidimicrobiales bacterium]|jgi:hypothetical protein|nr:hypothetical protein [Acidimicrobiales bacterium]